MPTTTSFSFPAVARQTKTINFSLSEANSVQETWILERDKHGGVLSDGPTVGKSDAGPLKPVRRQRQKNKMADAEEDELTMWLRQQEISVCVSAGINNYAVTPRLSNTGLSEDFIIQPSAVNPHH